MKKGSQNLTPAALQLTFDIANMVPANKAVPSFFESIKKDEITRANYDRLFVEWFESLREFPELFEFLSPSTEDAKNPEKFRIHIIGQFDAFASIRKLVDLIADYAEKFREKVESGNPHYYWHGLDLTVILNVGDRQKEIADGIIRYKIEWYAEVFEGVDIAKIRRCPICEKVFWQNRKDKKTCSKPCSNVLAKRDHRELMKKNFE